MIPEKFKKNNNNYPSYLRHTLGYLPTILLKSIIEDKILDKKENEEEIKFPKIFSFKTVCLFIDISHFFDNNFDNKTNTNLDDNKKKKKEKD